MRHLIDIQKQFNLASSKASFFADSLTILTTASTAGHLLDGEVDTKQDLESKLSKPNQVLVVPDTDKTKWIHHDNVIDKFLKLVADYLNLMSEISGVRQELMGGSEYAQQSGIAIHLKQEASVRNNIFLINLFAGFLKDIGFSFIDGMKELFCHKKHKQYYSHSKKVNFILNSKDDPISYMTDLLDFRASIEEVSNFQSTAEKRAHTLETILQSPFFNLLIDNKDIRETLGLFVEDELINSLIDYFSKLDRTPK